ncbi:MAG: hypothetical protein HZC29_03650 [Thaumarchaeota archaeon]|nr:hypothetical protein [Nitrososphaerota archaeon]
MQLPVNAVVIIAIVLLILLVIGAFFMFGSQSTISGAECSKVVTEQCESFRDTTGLTNNYIDQNYPAFSKCCRSQYSMEPIQCVTRYCGYPIPRDACKTLCRMAATWTGDKSKYCNGVVAAKPEIFSGCSCDTAIRDAAAGLC